METENEQNKFILLKGDISGIQEFIFNVKSEKAANSIKGRSFFMKILTEISIRYFFDSFNVADSLRDEYRISTSGGNFFILLPNCVDVEQKIDKIQIEFSKALQFTGIQVALGFVFYDEKNYSNCLIHLNKNVKQNKLKIHGKIDKNEFTQIFDPQKKSDFDVVDSNDKWKKITDSMREKNSCFSISKNGTNNLKINNNTIELFGYTCSFHVDNLEKDIINVSNYIEGLFPINNSNQIIDFEDLCKQNEGAKKLGILKMDVDNLGITLEKIKSYSEHKEFDIKLSLFFNENVKKIINFGFFTNIYGDTIRFEGKIYPVTAGGDDSFFVGNWEIILNLAQCIQSEFSKNPYFKSKELTISAGYIIVDSKFPVVRFSQLADEALHKAKYKYEKGNICLFNEVVSWDFLEKIQHFKSVLNRGVNSKSKALLAKSRQSAIRGIDENKISLKENWEISYFLREYTAIQNVIEIRNEIRNNIEHSILPITTKKNKRAYRLILPIAARLLELKLRTNK
jgi:CRISPR-associated protein Csm1